MSVKLCETPFTTFQSKLNFSVKAFVKVEVGIEILCKAAAGDKVTFPTLYPWVLLWDCSPPSLMFPVHSPSILLSLASSSGNHLVGRRLFYICSRSYFLSKSSCSKSLTGKRQYIMRPVMCLQPFLRLGKNQQGYLTYRGCIHILNSCL